MKKGLVVALLVSFALLLGASGAFSQPAKTSAPSGEPIKIGASLPLTGIASEQAKWVKAGYEAWADDVNKRGGLQLCKGSENLPQSILYKRAEGLQAQRGFPGLGDPASHAFPSS